MRKLRIRISVLSHQQKHKVQVNSKAQVLFSHPVLWPHRPIQMPFPITLLSEFCSSHQMSSYTWPRGHRSFHRLSWLPSWQEGPTYMPLCTGLTHTIVFGVSFSSVDCELSYSRVCTLIFAIQGYLVSGTQSVLKSTCRMNDLWMNNYVTLTPK